MTFYKNRDIILRQKILNIGNVLFPWEVMIMYINQELWDQTQQLCEMGLKKNQENLEISITLSLLSKEDLETKVEEIWKSTLKKLLNASSKESWNVELHQLSKNNEIVTTNFSDIHSEVLIKTILPYIEHSVIRLDFNRLKKPFHWIIMIY